MNVLLSSVSRKVSLARTWLKACQKREAVLIVGDMNPDCAGMYEGMDSIKLPALDSESFRPILKAACLKFNVSLVVNKRDEEVLAFAEWKDEFAKDGVRLLAPSLETVKLCQDKILFADWCLKHGFKVPCIYDSYTLAFPAFMRSRKGKGGSAAVRVPHFEDFRYYLKRFGPEDTITQEFIRAPEYSIDVFALEDGTVISAVCRQRIQMVAGESWHTMTIRDDALQAEAVRLSQALKLTGHAVLQCFVKDGEILWIEVNPRFGGASALAFEAGCDSTEWLMGEPTPTPLAPYQVGLTMLRYTQDRFTRGA